MTTGSEAIARSGAPSRRWSVARATLSSPLIGVIVLLACVVTGTAIGPVAIGADKVAAVVLAHATGVDSGVDPAFDAIVWHIRLPRVLLAGLVGAALACSGAAYQGVFRNPLADPYLLGSASGAGLAATIVIVSGLPHAWGPFSVLTLAAFAGALATVFLVYGLARSQGHAPATTLVLAGAAVSSLAVSAISYLMITNDRDTVSILSWLLGGFNDSSWRDMWFILPYALPAAAVIFLHGRILNALQLDEPQAQQLGIDVERTRLIVLVAASLAAASAVAVAGIIGFVGLIAPHVVRLLVGPDYRRILPLVALLGASFLIVADIVARTLISPSEVPVGVVTSMVGAPFFLWLLRRRRKAFF